MNRLKPLGEVELEILTIVWDLKEASVNDVLKVMRQKRELAYTSVMSMMQTLAKKNYLTFRQDGRSYIYQAAIDPAEVRNNLLEKTIENVFKNSPSDLVMHLIKSEKMTDEEKEEIKKIIGGLK